MKWLEIIYRVALSLFEFIIDILIVLLTILVIKALFNDNIITNGITLLVIFCGLIYAFNDFWEVYKENKFNKKYAR